MKKKYIIIVLLLLITFFIAYYMVYQYQNNGSVELELVNKMEYHNENDFFRTGTSEIISEKKDIYYFLYLISRHAYADSLKRSVYSLARERLEADTTSNNEDLFNLLKEAFFSDSLARVFIQSVDLKNYDYFVGFDRILKCKYSTEYSEQEWIPNDDRIPLELICLPDTEETLYIYRIKAPKGKFR